MQINIIDKSSTHNTTSKPNRDIKYIVIHYTAGTTSKTGSAINTAHYFTTTTVQASADFVVDDTTIVQCNPDIKNRYSWHCGGGKQTSYGGSLYKICTNANSIGIEVCSTNDTKKVTNANDSHWSYTDAAVEQTILLTKYLMEVYNISADHVVRHYDVNGKFCPGIIGWNDASGDESKWLAFKARLGSVAPQPQKVNYKAIVTASVLNCRSGHATAYPIVKTFNKGTVLTITQEQYRWGYVDEIGWVSLAYVEKLKEPDKIEEEEEMTQEQFNTMMDNWIAEQANKEASSWSAEARTWAEGAGLISGDTEGKKMYKKLLTREELVTVLHRALHRYFI